MGRNRCLGPDNRDRNADGLVSNRLSGLGIACLGIAVAATAFLGPLGVGWMTFRLSDNAVTQFKGGEIVSLGVVAPLLILAGWLWIRGHPLAAPLAIGPALYTCYTYTTAVLGQEPTLYDGNVEKFYPLLTALVLVGGITAYAAWGRLSRSPAAIRLHPPQRMLAWAFIILGAFFALTWASQVRLVYIGEAPEDYQTGPSLFWLIKFLDFAICIPVLIATGLGLRRASLTARKASFAVAGFATCLICAVFAMAIAMQVTDDPSASVILLVASGIGTTIIAGMTVRLMHVFWESGEGQSGS